ncbi:MAG: hypothetical protein WAX89_07040 [Alphaproteobacteria bacterium]
MTCQTLVCIGDSLVAGDERIVRKKIDFDALSIPDLLSINAQTLHELRQRQVIRSANKPVGDFAEYLFCKAFGWEMTGNSQLGYDAKDSKGIRYQIKSRLLVNNNHSERQLSALRNLDRRHFDFIAGVLFLHDYSIYKAALIPYQIIIDCNPYFTQHTNSHIFYLRDSVWEIPGVRDVTEELKFTALNL